MSNYTCFRHVVTIKRKSGGAYVNGQYVAGSTADIILKASIQPASPEDMQELPEGRRSDEVFKMFTKTRMFTVTDENPDFLIIDGVEYEVISVGKYQSKVISHYKVLISKKAEVR